MASTSNSCLQLLLRCGGGSFFDQLGRLLRMRDVGGVARIHLGCLRIGALGLLALISGLMDRSCVDTWYQLGFDFQAGEVTGDVNESLENRTCDLLIKSALAGGISAQKSAAKDAGSIYK